MAISLKDAAITGVGVATGTPLGMTNAGLKSMGIDMTNPFKKPDIPDVPTVVAPANVNTPAMPTTSSLTTVDDRMPKLAGALIGNPGAPTINAGDSAFKQNQMMVAGRLADQAMGVGPSIVENQLRQAQEANLAATLAAANSARGASQPAATRMAMQSNAEAQGRMAQEAATARLQEQMQAAGLLGQVAGQGREQDLQQAQIQNQAALEQYKGQLQVAIAQGQLDQSTAETLFNAEVQKQFKNAELAQQFELLKAQYANMGLDAAKANQLATIQVQQLQQQGVLGQAGLILQQDATNKQFVGNLFGAAGSGAAAYATMASDERLKRDVKPGDAKIQAFLDSIDAHDYEYKDEKHGKGRFVSPMAQELLKTEVGKSMVVPTDEGYMVDYGKGFGALLAAQAALNKRLAKIEKKGK